ncbi:WD repeat-containing protein 18-like [Argonauta hians]
MSVLRWSEVIISSNVANKGPESKQKGSICLIDINTGAAITSLREELGPVANGLCLIKKNYLMSASENELHVWNLSHSQAPAISMELPDKVSSLAMSPDSLYCVAGIQEKLYVWCVLTGQLLSIIHRHFQNIVCIKFADNLTFLTGAEDNQIIAWSLVDIFNSTDNKTNKKSSPEPLFVWNDHTLPITDLYVGAGGIRARVVSSSLDRTCKIWDLATGRLLCSFLFSESLLSVCMNMAENRLYAGGSSGKIYVVDLSQGSANSSDDTTIAGGGSDKTKFYFLGHNKHITSLSVSMDGSLLVSASDDCTVKVWDTSNGRCLKTLMHKSPVNNAFIAPVNRSAIESKPKDSFPIHKFETEIMSKKDNISSVLYQSFLPNTNVCRDSYPFQSDIFGTILAGNSQIVPSDSVAEDEEQSSRERTDTIAKLKKQIDLIKTENEKLFTFSVSQMLK